METNYYYYPKSYYQRKINHNKTMKLKKTENIVSQVKDEIGIKRFEFGIFHFFMLTFYFTFIHFIFFSFEEPKKKIIKNSTSRLYKTFFCIKSFNILFYKKKKKLQIWIPDLVIVNGIISSSTLDKYNRTDFHK